jgi:UV DNA damage repair endonuclease
MAQEQPCHRGSPSPPTCSFPFAAPSADYEEIAATLAAVGTAARAARQRLTAHPSHFVQLASPKPELLARSLRHLELNSRVGCTSGLAAQPSTAASCAGHACPALWLASPPPAGV